MSYISGIQWTTEEAIEDFQNQDKGLKPGTWGWWQVWGATPMHIRQGDIVLTVTDNEVETLFIEDTFTAKAHPVRVGIVVNGQKQTIGALCNIVLVRRSQHHTLAE